jgi:asparagine synthase (glutamine-hydrolysing)
MCGIAGAIAVGHGPVPNLPQVLSTMSRLIAHRGRDGHGFWQEKREHVGFAHRRLAIIDPTPAGDQPMIGADGSVIVFNGQIYNYLELANELKSNWPFRSKSDTETILAAYDRWGLQCLDHLRGMFAFALWDGERFFAARDRFGIKPFYYAVVDGVFYFASEIKALLPVLPEIATDRNALAEYLTFQYTVGDRSLFKHVQTLLPGHALVIDNGSIRTFRYWDVHYDIDREHDFDWFSDRMKSIVEDSVKVHLRSDVPIGAYISGGFDSSLVANIAARELGSAKIGFHGKFTDYPGYDESRFAEVAAHEAGLRLHQRVITSQDFRDTIEDVIYHLDHPVAGPGAFAQYLISDTASSHVKVVLGGQGGDEIFGGYARYIIACLEQQLKGAIDGSPGDRNVALDSILANLPVLREYKPLLQHFFAKGMFGPLDQRYFRLIARSDDADDEIDWHQLDHAGVYDRFRQIFNTDGKLGSESYFDSMMHFDFKCLLPALLHVEDRMSMAHALESRVPLVDTDVVEFAATIPANFKFKDGHLKHFLKAAFSQNMPPQLVNAPGLRPGCFFHAEGSPSALFQ